MRKKQCGKKENKLEKKGYLILSELGLSFEKQYVYGGRLVADAYVSDLNLLIQFDGDYWHGNIKVFNNLNEYQLKQKIKDQKANAFALNQGYNLIRCWECNLSLEHLKKLIQVIQQGTEKCVLDG